MRATATNRLWAPLLLVTALLALGATRASAQVDPFWDHYKLYVTPPLSLPPPLPFVQLTDQWGPYQHNVLHLDYWMNPVEKTVFDPPTDPYGAPIPTTYPINDFFLHYTWWRISPQFNEKLVAVNNQFGDQTLYVKDAEYLLNPALKNESGTPPLRNHYKCYACQGQPINKPVNLRDQFDPTGTPGWDATVTYPRWFCNPTTKQIVGSPQLNPFYDSYQHYVCYDYVPPDPAIHPLSFTDQFLYATMDVGPSRWLCVPTYKTGFTSNTRGTWGQLKTLYR